MAESLSIAWRKERTICFAERLYEEMIRMRKNRGTSMRKLAGIALKAAGSFYDEVGERLAEEHAEAMAKAPQPTLP